MEQAHLLAGSLFKAQIAPEIILAGPLQRTRITAQIVAESLQMPPSKLRIDARLTEIDYGTWEGKSTEAIIAMGAEKQLNDWNTKSIVPQNANWKPSEEKISSDIHMLLEEISQGTSLIITSNGILRFFARAASNVRTLPNLKVLPGNGCIMTYDGTVWAIKAWNLPPDLLMREIPT